jgi:ABC-type transport system substrate-binding protein
VRQAVNVAINRADLIRYATKGNGVIISALLPPNAFGYNSQLAPYPFDPAKARQLFHDAGYPNGLSVTLIAPKALEVQATVVGKMIEQVGPKVTVQILDAGAYNRKTALGHLEQPAEQQTWDIALTSYYGDGMNFPAFEIYHVFALGGGFDWVIEEPELKQLATQVIRTVDREHQQALIRQMEQHTLEQAYFLFLYNPIHLYAVNKAVEFVPYQTGVLTLAETSVTDQHWSVRKQKATVEK